MKTQSEIFAAFSEFLDTQMRNARQDMANASGREDYGMAAQARGVMIAAGTLSVSMKNHAKYPSMQAAFLKKYSPNR